MSGSHAVARSAAAPGPVDASMDLLNQIMRQPLDPDYALVAGRSTPPPRTRGALAVVALVVGAMFAVAALQTSRSAPGLAAERTELIAQVAAAEAHQDELQGRVAALDGEIAALRTAGLGTGAGSAALERRIDALGPAVGAVAVTGPGLSVTVDDAPGATADGRDQVLDVDLQALVNGLWEAGAEAVSVNGHRLSALTAIRGAGDAITVDYRSLTRPYRVEAVGDPRTLESRYVQTAGGLWWSELAQNRGMPYAVSGEARLTLSADPGLALRYARKGPS